MIINEIIGDVPDNHQLIAANQGLLMSPDVQKFMAFAESVKSDCQPYLKAVDNSPVRAYKLFRGIVNTSKLYIAKTVRLTGRRPKDTHQLLHNKINIYFKKNFGAEFRNGIFATSDYNQAVEYSLPGDGDVYIIFPVGEFKYLWSPEVSDLLDAIYSNDILSDRLSQGKKSGWNEFRDDWLGTYKTTNLPGAIDSGNEIMIRCKEYYGIKVTDQFDERHWGAFEELLRL